MNLNRCPMFMRMLPLLFLAIGPAMVAAEAEVPKEFILYTGASLKVLDGEQRHPVVGVNAFAVRVEVDGKVESREYDELGEFWIDREMKLNSLSASIEAVESRKAFTAGRDRMPDWGSVSTGSYATIQGADDSKGGTGLDPSLMLNSGAGQFQSNGPGGPGFVEEGTDPTHDALEVTFQLASVHAIPEPYLLLVTDYRRVDAPGATFRKFHLEVLDGIGPEPRSVRLLQGGFPQGFGVENFELFLYSGRREVPTNLSDKQVALTRDEAMQYLVLEYLVGHKGETLGPRPMWVGLPAETRQLIREGAANPRIGLSLDAKGRVTALRIINGPEPDAVILDAIRAFRFYPALEQGRAVESTYELRPKEVAP